VTNDRPVDVAEPELYMLLNTAPVVLLLVPGMVQVVVPVMVLDMVPDMVPVPVTLVVAVVDAVVDMAPTAVV